MVTDGGSRALDPKLPPGGDFDLTRWALQEPVGSPGSLTTIPASKLAGPKGFTDSYFYTDPADGAMVFWTPENGVHTANSSYPRSELRELNADGSNANWDIAGTHVLSATLAVVKIPDHVCTSGKFTSGT